MRWVSCALVLAVASLAQSRPQGLFGGFLPSSTNGDSPPKRPLEILAQGQQAAQKVVSGFIQGISEAGEKFRNDTIHRIQSLLPGIKNMEKPQAPETTQEHSPDKEMHQEHNADKEMNHQHSPDNEMHQEHHPEKPVSGEEILSNPQKPDSADTENRQGIEPTKKPENLGSEKQEGNKVQKDEPNEDNTTEVSTSSEEGEIKTSTPAASVTPITNEEIEKLLGEVFDSMDPLKEESSSEAVTPDLPCQEGFKSDADGKCAKEQEGNKNQKDEPNKDTTTEVSTSPEEKEIKTSTPYARVTPITNEELKKHPCFEEEGYKRDKDGLCIKEQEVE